jgi:hypothetical protein
MSINIYADAHTNTADTFEEVFTKGKVSGQIRAGYFYNDPKITGISNNYATAIGGQLKFETARLYGFDAGAAFYTSHAITPFSGDRNKGKFNDELTTDDKYYDILAEAYLDYTYQDFKIRIGRQRIDTPYADSDDIRMTPNTFEGVTATYTYGNFSFIGAYLTRWQGPDAGEYTFEDLAEESDGTAIAAVTFGNDMVEAGLWYYHIDHYADIFYTDISGTYAFNEHTSLKGAVQLAKQSEVDNSSIDGLLCGAMAELNYSGITLGIAYDQLFIDSDKVYFGGFGGGVGFVNMFEMTAGVFTVHQDAKAWKFTLGYDLSTVGIDGLSLEYDYGDFKGDVAHEAREHNFILSYAPSDKWDIEVVYDRIKDVHKDIGEDEVAHLHYDASVERVLVRANYNF